MFQVLESQQPLILYFPNSFTWLPWTASWNIRRDFVRKVKDMFGRLTGRVVLICGQDNWNDAYREMQKYVSFDSAFIWHISICMSPYIYIYTTRMFIFSAWFVEATYWEIKRN